MTISSPCLLAKELPRERVHKIDLLAHDTCHWLIRTRHDEVVLLGEFVSLRGERQHWLGWLSQLR
jgi:hypothetical protein